MHFLLYRNETGEVAIRWRWLVGSLAFCLLITLLAIFFTGYLVGAPFQPTRVIVTVSIIFGTLPLLIGLHVAKRQAEGRSAWRFSLAELLVGMAIACLLFAAMGIDRRADLERYSARKRLEKALMEIVGSGKVHVSSTTLIQVKRPTFDDYDLSKIAELNSDLKAIEAPIFMLDVSGTKITDQGAAAIQTIDTLEYCFLHQTGVTDKTVDAIGQLSKLKVVSFTSTRVTPERLLQLIKERPELNIEPKTYQKLKSR